MTLGDDASFQTNASKSYDLMAAYDIYQIIWQIITLLFTEACYYWWDKMSPVSSWYLQQNRMGTYLYCLFLQRIRDYDSVLLFLIVTQVLSFRQKYSKRNNNF